MYNYKITILRRNVYIYNRITFSLLKHVKTFDLIPNECSQQEIWLLSKSHAVILHELRLGASYCREFEFITFLGEF